MIHIQHLETDITQACQLSCVGCNHHVPLYRVQPGGPKMTTARQVASDLTHLSRVLHTDIWGALGGEPTLNPDLVEILEIVDDSRIADIIEVWTNGIALPKMSPLFWRSFDRLVLSVYDGKHTVESLATIRQRCLDNDVELRVIDERASPNFKTLFEPIPTDAAATRAKFAGCFFRQFSRVVNNGYFFTCCCAPHMPVLVQHKPFGTDGIAVDSLTEDALRAYLERSEPLGACSLCAGRDTAVDLQWHEEKDPVRWLRASAGATC